MRGVETDILVIGSGAGGGTLAAELAPLCRDGVRVTVLEWGPKLRDEELTGREVEMARRLYFDAGGFLTRDRCMTLAFAKAYGGSTVVYTGVSLPIEERTVVKWGVPGLPWADLKARSDKHAAAVEAHVLPEELVNENNRLFRRGCERLGYRVDAFAVNVRGCRGSGLCNLGCPNGAKMGTHRVQLPAAERAGAAVVTNCRVDRLFERGCEATVLAAPAGDPSAWEPGAYRVRAKVVIVAGGAVQSPALLMRSRLPLELPALGRYFTCHPALILVAEHDRPIAGYEGHPKSYYSDHFAADRRFLLETCMYFPFVTAKSLAGFGEEHGAIMSRMDRLQMILSLALDAALPEQRVTIDGDGQPVVDYRLTPQVLEALHASALAAARIFFAAGARRVHVPGATRFLIDAADADRLDALAPRSGFLPGKVSVTSAHLMGGCRMGASPADSVTDAWGQVHGAPWLFVADASLFPGSAEINPYLTVMALADRVAERVRTRAQELLA